MGCIWSKQCAAERTCFLVIRDPPQKKEYPLNILKNRPTCHGHEFGVDLSPLMIRETTECL
ncbi:hypothetical protein BpHYR1_043355 [Brachionus plicatilis]|uniref:Uncharacterized protein n=1 Tax=Brachionus plicatilis TaxID=10195 RepID=A0A3M7RMV3_BRAPC|nr:hypothetical protein BpHYR1_043355 [Brachionus plicatilis]